MTSVFGSRPLQTLRHAPMQGEIGHPGTCPLCSTSASGSRAVTPPCLACRDELRARLREMNTVAMIERATN